MAPGEVKTREIEQEFENWFFKPRGVPLCELEVLKIGHEEMEAIRLIDVEHMNQQDAAEKMNISRATMQRVIDGAREKVGRALIEGKAIEISGGHYIVKKRCGRRRRFRGEEI